MGRRKTIHVNELQLLVAIGRETELDIAACLREAKKTLKESHKPGSDWRLYQEACQLKDHAAFIKANGVTYNLVAFAGRELTASERIRHQQAIRRLADQNLVRLYGDHASRVKVLPKGWKAIAALSGPASPIEGTP